jgi:hypothetical protein
MKSILALLACASLLLSCHKSKNPGSLTGSWKLTETFNGGGQIDWTRVNPSAEIILTFNSNKLSALCPRPFHLCRAAMVLIE